MAAASRARLTDDLKSSRRCAVDVAGAGAAGCCWQMAETKNSYSEKYQKEIEGVQVNTYQKVILSKWIPFSKFVIKNRIEVLFQYDIDHKIILHSVEIEIHPWLLGIGALPIGAFNVLCRYPFCQHHHQHPEFTPHFFRKGKYSKGKNQQEIHLPSKPHFKKPSPSCL